MGDTSIELWLNQYQLEALERILSEHGTDTNTVMQARLLEFYRQTVPEQERTDINNRIEAKRLAEERLTQEMSRFSVFHITENGAERYFETQYGNGLEFLQIGWWMRKYLHGEFKVKPECFADTLLNPVAIDVGNFDSRVGELLDNSKNIVGVFDIDFDKQEFSGVYRFDGWKTFAMKDISVAAYHAYRGEDRPWDKRVSIFLDYLDGKEIKQDQRPPMQIME